MHTHSPRVRPDHDTLLPAAGTLAAVLATAVLTAAVPAPSAAQGAVPCTAIEDDAERLACYDRALRGTPPAPAARPAPATRATPAAPAAAPAQSTSERPRERPVRESTAAAANAAPAAPAVANRNENGITPIVIVGVRLPQGREAAFTAEDGTIWVQTDSQRILGVPEPPFDAQLRSGAMGSYFLTIGDKGRGIRVRAAR